MITFKQYLLEQLNQGIKLHSSLNPKLWDNNKLKEEVKNKLLDISYKFIDYLSIDSSFVKDIIITGSNCAYTYTKFSDIDLHLVIDVKTICDSCPGDFIQDCFLAKKEVWNENHKLKIKGYPIELYAQPEDDNLVASGVFSLTKNKWLIEPSSLDKDVHINSDSVKIKSTEFIERINNLIDSKSTNIENLYKIKDQLKRYRQAGLEKSGELGIENIVYKTLRNNGYLQKYISTLLN